LRIRDPPRTDCSSLEQNCYSLNPMVPANYSSSFTEEDATVLLLQQRLVCAK
jgi:hypothetical protein